MQVVTEAPQYSRGKVVGRYLRRAIMGDGFVVHEVAADREVIRRVRLTGDEVAPADIARLDAVRSPIRMVPLPL